ncbi:MAG TPA: DUF523 and DUF1722 domain-containing protein [Vicinamibacterales bacterium]|nr:DUF523 and DUF1722 domain-containing protein [Vicinamibacterales bacterium]
MTPLRIGISSCLLGDEVRFDGGHKRDPFLTETLGPFVEWVRVCPEVEVGMGVPRETLRLVKVGGDTRMITTRTGIDHTDEMRAFAARRARELAALGLRGYVLKKDSPSCGMTRVKVYDAEAKAPVRDGVGIYAAVLAAAFPALPIEEEGRLQDPVLRENFIERVFACDRLRTLFDGRWTLSDLIGFHTAHKMALLAHSTSAYHELGRLVAAAKGVPRGELRRRYEALFMKTLARPATPARHTNVLRHMAGHLKKLLDDGSRRELGECIEEYRRELVPLIVPLTLLRHHVRAHGVAYLAGQTYLEPHPRELMLRNHV